jgi:hypothetical protein
MNNPGRERTLQERRGLRLNENKKETFIKEISMKKTLLIIAGIVFLAICAFQFADSSPVFATDQPAVQAPEEDSAAVEEGEEAVEGEVPPPEEGAAEEEPLEEEAPEGEEGEVQDSGDQG